MKTRLERPVSLGFAVFVAILGVVALIILLSSLVSLAVFSGTLDDMAQKQSAEINKQIVMNFESYINSVIETANYVQFASINLDTVRDAEELAALYRANADIKPDVISVYLFDERGERLAGPPLDFITVNAVRARPWFSEALELREIFHFSADGTESVAESRDDIVISVSKAVDYLAQGKAFEGVLLIELAQSALTAIARRSDLGPGGHMLILDEDGRLLYSSEASGSGLTSRSAELASSMYLGSRRASVGGMDMILNANTLAHTRWRIVTVGNVGAAAEARAGLLGITALVLAVSIALSAIVAGAVSARVSKPVGKLKETMLRIEKGDLDAPLEVHGQKEIVLLAHAMASMVARVRELMADLVEEQREKRKTELRALQNQINPHFLYNTLDSIVWLAERGRNDDVIRTVVALARFFRIGISKGHAFIPVEDEVAHVESYLTIQSIRYVERFEYSISLQPGMRGMKVMKLILQPLVENAIYHGIGDEGGHISIRGRIEGSYIIFSVTNSGYGIGAERIEAMYAAMRGGAGSGVGIRNVYQRLKLYYGEQADVRISSVPDESTTVTLYIPIGPGEGETGDEHS